MADASTTQTLLIGAVGGLIPLAFKYVVDRFTESHKARVGLTTKRREWFYDKQAKVICDLYSRLSHCHGISGNVMSVKFNNAYHLAFTNENGFLKDHESFTEHVKRLRLFLLENKLYIPRRLDDPIHKLVGLIIGQCLIQRIAFERREDQDILKTIDDSSHRLNTAMEEIGNEFRELIMGDPRPRKPVRHRLMDWLKRKPDPATPSPSDATIEAAKANDVATPPHSNGEGSSLSNSLPPHETDQADNQADARDGQSGDRRPEDHSGHSVHLGS